MKRMKKALAIFLTLVMTLSALPAQAISVAAAGDGTEDAPDPEFVEQQLNNNLRFQLPEGALNTLSLPTSPTIATVPIPGDTLVFEGGTEGEGVYVVEMGALSYEDADGRFPFTIHRPKGGEADYAVSVDIQGLSGSFGTTYRPNIYASADREGGEITGVVFEPGEEEKTIYLDYPNPGNITGLATYYLDFHYAYRTEIKHRLVQFRWNCTYDGSYTVPAEDAAVYIPREIFLEDNEAVIPISVEFAPQVQITADTRLVVKPSWGGDDPDKLIELPAQEIGAATSVVTFLYPLTEADIDEISLWPEGVGNDTSLFKVQEIKGFGIYGTDGQVQGEPGSLKPNPVATPDPLRNASPTACITLRPRYGDITLDNDVYESGKTVTLTVPIENQELLEKFGVYTAANVEKWFRVSLDGGKTLEDQSGVTMENGVATAAFPVPALEEGATVYAEIFETDENGVSTAIYGKYKALTVGEGGGDIVPVESITIEDLPGNPILLNPDPARNQYQLRPVILPANATYKTVTWSCDKPAVADISATGLLTVKGSGTATITAEADHVVGQATIIVGSARPELVSTSVFVDADSFDILQIPLTDNFKLASQGFPNFKENVTYTVNSKYYDPVNGDETGYVSNIGIEGRPNAAIDDKDRYRPQVYWTDGDDAFATFSMLVSKVIPPYTDKGELQPAFILDVTAKFDGGLYPDSKATYNVYIKPPALQSGLLQGSYQASVLTSAATIPTLQWQAKNLLNSNFTVGYEVYWSDTAPGSEGYHPTRVAYGEARSSGSASDPRNAIRIQNGQDYYNPDAANNPLRDGTITLDADLILDLIPVGEDVQWLRIRFYAENPTTQETIEDWAVYTLTSPTAAGGASFRVQGKDEPYQINLKEQPEIQLVEDLQGEYAKIGKSGDPRQAMADFLGWLEDTKGSRTVELTAPEEWGVPTINGKVLTNYSSFKMVMTQGEALLNIKWPMLPAPYRAVFQLDYSDLFLFDVGFQFTGPISFYALNARGGRTLIDTLTPSNGLVALLPTEKQAAEIVSNGVYLTTKVGDKDYTVLYRGAERLSYMGAVPAEKNSAGQPLALVTETGEAQIGRFVTNRVALSERHDLAVSFVGYDKATQQLYVHDWTLLDGDMKPVDSGDGIDVTGGHPNAAVTILIPYIALLEHPEYTLAVRVRLTGGTRDDTRLELIDGQKLRQLLSGSLPDQVPYMMELGGSRPDIAYAHLNYTTLRNGGVNGETDTEERSIDLMRSPSFNGQTEINTQNAQAYVEVVFSSKIEPTDLRMRLWETVGREEISQTSYARCYESTYFDCGVTCTRAIFRIADTVPATSVIGTGNTYGRMTFYRGEDVRTTLDVNISTTDTGMFAEYQRAHAAEMAQKRTRIELPKTQTYGINVKADQDPNDDVTSDYARQGLQKFMGFGDFLPFQFRVEQVKGQENEFEIRAALRMTASTGNLVGEFVNTLSDQTGEREFTDLINEIQGLEEKGGIEVSLGMDTPLDYESSIKGYMRAKGHYDPNSHTMEIEFQDGALVMYTKVGFEIEIPVAEIFFIGFGMSGEFGSNVYMAAPTKNEDASKNVQKTLTMPCDTGVEQTLAITLAVSGGIGLDVGLLNAKIGVKGTGTFTESNMVVTRPYLDNSNPRYRQEGQQYKLSTGLYAFAKAGFLCFSVGVEWLMVEGSTTWNDPDDETNPYLDPTVPFKKPRIQSLALVGDLSPRLVPLAAALPEGAQLVRNRLYDSALARCWSGGILYNDIGEIGDYNDDRIRSSGDSLSYPFEDEGGDFAFDAAASNGRSVVAWEHIRSKVGDLTYMDEQTSVRSLSAQTEIVASVHDGAGWSTPVRLSDNNQMDMAPAVAVGADGGATVVWTRGLIGDGGQTFNSEDVESLFQIDATTELVYASIESGETAWSAPKILYRAPEGRTVARYDVARGDDGSFLVALALSGGERSEDGMNEIAYLYVGGDGTPRTVGTSTRGLNPQVLSVDGTYYTGLYASTPSQQENTPAHDIWFGAFAAAPSVDVTDETKMPVRSDAPVDMGLILPGLRPLGAPATVGADFRFTASADTLENLGLIWPSAAVDKEGNASLALEAAKLLKDGATFGLTPSITLDAGGSAYIASYDAVMTGDTVDAAILAAEDGGSAALYRTSGRFENAIKAAAKYSRLDLMPNMPLPVTFLVQNTGYEPITGLTVDMGGGRIVNIGGLNVLPGQTYTAEGRYTLPAPAPGTVDYTLTAAFHGGGEKSFSDTLSLEAADLQIDVTQMAADQNGGSITLSVTERSGFGLPDDSTVTFGLYEDIEGKTPLAGSVRTLSSEETAALRTGACAASLDYPGDTTGRLYGIVTARHADGTAVWDTDLMNNVVSIGISYAVRFYDGDTLLHTVDVKSHDSIGDAWPAAPSKSGRSFLGWFTEPDGGGKAFDATIPISANTSLYAAWSSEGGGSAGGGGGGLTIPAQNGAVTVSVTQSGGTVTLSLPAGKVSALIQNAADGMISLDLTGVGGVEKVSIPTSALKQFAEAGLGMALKLPGRGMTIDKTALASIAQAAGGAALTITLARRSDLSDGQRAALREGEAVYEIALTSGEAIHTFDGTLTVTVGYDGRTPAAVWYLDESGAREKVPNSKYSGTDRSVTFTPPHLSVFVVGRDGDAEWVNPFTDVKDTDWFYGDVAYTVANGLFSGTTETTFSPNAPMTRGMLATVLWRLAGSPAPMGAAPFPDLSQDWYRDAVAWAAEQKIVTGYGTGVFGPGDSVTREQAAVMLYRFALWEGKGGAETSAGLLPYADAGQISSWALEAAGFCQKNGLITGKPGNLFEPQGMASRAELAAILHRFMLNVERTVPADS